MKPSVMIGRPLLMYLFLCFPLLGLSCTPTSINIPSGYFSAIIRDDGKIQTNFSTDGLNWQQPGHVHTDIGVVDKGVGIATDKSGTLVFLAFFAQDSSGSNKLFVRTGLGNNWESHLPTQVSISAASAPAICRIDDRYLFIAWNKGGGISTAALDSQHMGDNNAFILKGDITDTRASKIDGAPSVSALNNRILIVWRVKNNDNTKEHASNLINFNPANTDVRFGNTARLIASPPQGRLVGFPQITNNGTGFVLSTSYSNLLGNDTTVQRFAYFSSSDGNTWSPFTCLESGDDLLDLHVRPQAMALDNNNLITHLVVGNNANIGGQIIRGCPAGDLRLWGDNQRFNNKGKISLQPAIIFRKGNQ